MLLYIKTMLDGELPVARPLRNGVEEQWLKVVQAKIIFTNTSIDPCITILYSPIKDLVGWIASDATKEA